MTPPAAAQSTAGAAKLAQKAGIQSQGGLHLTPPAENRAAPMSSPEESPGDLDGLSYSKNWVQKKVQKRKSLQDPFWRGSPGSPSYDSQSLSSCTLCRLSWRWSCCSWVIFSLIQHCHSKEWLPPWKAALQTAAVCWLMGNPGGHWATPLLKVMCVHLSSITQQRPQDTPG